MSKVVVGCTGQLFSWPPVANWRQLGKNGDWSNPKNLGFPVNSPDDDLFFMLSKNNKSAFFASAREDSYGNLDIYEVKFEKSTSNKSLADDNLTDSTDKQENEILITESLPADSTVPSNAVLTEDNLDKLAFQQEETNEKQQEIESLVLIEPSLKITEDNLGKTNEIISTENEEITLINKPVNNESIQMKNSNKSSSGLVDVSMQVIDDGSDSEIIVAVKTDELNFSLPSIDSGYEINIEVVDD